MLARPSVRLSLFFCKSVRPPVSKLKAWWLVTYAVVSVVIKHLLLIVCDIDVWILVLKIETFTYSWLFPSQQLYKVPNQMFFSDPLLMT